MAKRKRASWWKMFSHQRAALEALSDSEVGEGLKVAFRYFDGEEIGDGLSRGAFVAFSVVKPYIDESIAEYEESVANGKAGADTRWRR